MTSTLDLDALVLDRGAHASPDDGACVMEAVALVAGEAWSDHPACASPVIGAFLRAWNDALGTDDRQQLKRWIAPLVGTRGTPEQEERRAWMALDWLVRHHTPVWLRAAGLDSQAERLEGLPEFHPGMDVASVRPALEAVRSEAAGYAAGYAAWYAAQDAAGYAAGYAAGDAAGDALRPHVEALQESAHELVGRMVAVTDG